jgi:hypothetical protein
MTPVSAPNGSNKLVDDDESLMTTPEQMSCGQPSFRQAPRAMGET